MSKLAMTIPLTRAAARKLLLAAVTEGEKMIGAERGAAMSKSQQADVVAVRHVCLLIGREELQVPIMTLSRWFDQDHSAVIKAVRLAQQRLHREPWRSLHARLAAFVRERSAGAERSVPETRKPQAVAEPVKRQVGRTSAPKQPKTNSGDQSQAPGAGSDRDWWVKCNARFVERMRQVHPEREIALPRA